jgi:hypothetical protein
MPGELRSDDEYRDSARWHLERARSDLADLDAKRIPFDTMLVAALPPIPVALSGINSETSWFVWVGALVTGVALGVFTLRAKLSTPKAEQRDRLIKFSRDLESIIASDPLSDPQRELVDRAGDILQKLRGW